MECFLDCKGLACPAPVLKTKEAIEQQKPVRIVVKVDNPAARDNVSRFMSRSGYKTVFKQDGNDFVIIGEKVNDRASPVETLPSELTCSIASHENNEKTLILIATDSLGRETGVITNTDSSLGKALMKNFINTLKEISGLWRIVFLNSGVYLTIEGSPVLESLKELEKSGISILVCGTCLNFYGIMEKKTVGETTNMLDIVTSMQLANKVITIT